MPAGRPTKYRKDFAKQAMHLCKLGATDMDLAAALEVDVTTIWAWQSQHPEFSKAVKIEGKAAYDDRVERALALRAVGYSHDEIDIRVVDGKIVKTPIVKHYPPDTGAAMAWLKNRRPDVWRDRKAYDETPQIPYGGLQILLIDRSRANGQANGSDAEGGNPKGLLAVIEPS